MQKSDWNVKKKWERILPIYFFVSKDTFYGVGKYKKTFVSALSA